MPDRIFGHWTPERPHTMVVACSDGRLQEATDEFLHRYLKLAQFDRFYVPGGGGALSASDRDMFRAQQMRNECKYLIEAHQVEHVILVFHGPAADGPSDCVCADYRRKFPAGTPDLIRQQQARDAAELLQLAGQWTNGARVSVFRCEVGADRAVMFRALDHAQELEGTTWQSQLLRSTPAMGSQAQKD